MKQHLFTTVVLLTGILLLALNLLVTLEKPVQASPKRQYRVVALREVHWWSSVAETEAFLNQQAQKGWRLHSIASGAIILEK
jgi:hypothetical protein